MLLARTCSSLIALIAAPRAPKHPYLDWRTLTHAPLLRPLHPADSSRWPAASPPTPSARTTSCRSEMHPPRGMIDVVISRRRRLLERIRDTVSDEPHRHLRQSARVESRRFATRTIGTQLVITHELTHIFHLDRTRGIWALGQHIFGRAAPLFPNLYAPSWLTEGLAVYEESNLAGAGAYRGSEHRMIARSPRSTAPFRDRRVEPRRRDAFPSAKRRTRTARCSWTISRKTRGDTQRPKVRRGQVATYLIPYLLDLPAKQRIRRLVHEGVARVQRFDRAHDSREPGGRPLAGWRQLTRDGPYVFAPRWVGDSAIVYSGAPGRETFGAYRVDTRRRATASAGATAARRTFRSRTASALRAARVRESVSGALGPLVQRGTNTSISSRSTSGSRSPDVRADGAIVAAQIIPGATRLVRVSPRRQDDHAAHRRQLRRTVDRAALVARRRPHRRVALAPRQRLADRRHRHARPHRAHRLQRTSIEATPSWLPGDAGIMYSSDRDGATQIYVERFADARTFDEASTRRLSDVSTGVFDAVPSPSGRRATAVDFRIDGYHLGVGSYEPSSGTPVPDYRDTIPHAGVAPLITDDTGRVGPYHAWRTFYPRYWLPVVNPGIDGGYRFGLTTTGNDVIGRHSMQATLQFPTNNTGHRWRSLISVRGTWSADSVGRRVPGLADARRRLLARTRDARSSAKCSAARVKPTSSRRGSASAFARRSSVSGGFGVEARSHSTNAPVTLAELDTAGEFGSPSFPTLIAALGFANYQRPPFSISPEDGVQFNATVRDRLRSGPAGQGGGSLSTVGILSLYKSLDLPGFSHHVLALRGAAGWADVNATGYYVVGGISGSTSRSFPATRSARVARPFRCADSRRARSSARAPSPARRSIACRCGCSATRREFCRFSSIAPRSRSSAMSARRGARTLPPGARSAILVKRSRRR